MEWKITLRYLGDKPVFFLTREDHDAIRLDEDAHQYIVCLQQIAQAAKNCQLVGSFIARDIALEELSKQVDLLKAYESQDGIR
jgi:hypothetical protein